MIDSIREKVRSHLTQLGPHNDSAEPKLLTLQFDGGFTVSAELPLIETTGLRFSEFVVTFRNLAEATPEDLTRLAAALSERVHLLEPLRSLETDRDSKTVQMRSSHPRREGTALIYYEVMLKTAELRLHRMRRADERAQPQAVAAELSSQMFGDLVADVINVLTTFTSSFTQRRREVNT